MRTDTARALALVLAILAPACGGPGAAPARGGDTEQTGGGAASDHPARAAGCPTRFGEGGPSCEAGDDPGTCTYPEGTCLCAEEVWCGGAAPPPMPRLWRCERPRPACPEPGTPCEAGATSCQLDACGFDHVVCRDGTWTAEHGPYPP